MIERCINEVVSINVAELVKEEMFKAAIMVNGVYSTFDLKTYPAANDNVELQLHYMQVTDEEIASISDYRLKVMYFADEDCFGDAKHIGEPYYVGEQYYDATVNKIKEDLVKDKNAIWSTISVNEFGSGDERRFEIKYKRVVNTDDTKKPSVTDKMLIGSNNSKEWCTLMDTDSEICDISSVSSLDGTTYKISELVTHDKDYLYLPIYFGTVNSSKIVRIKVPLKTLKEALDQVE